MKTFKYILHRSLVWIFAHRSTRRIMRDTFVKLMEDPKTNEIMEVVLSKVVIFDNLYSEEELRELSIEESIYIIRKLKALSHSLIYGSIDVSDKANDNGQRFCRQFDVFLDKEEMIT